jgi:biotin carboxylase
VLKPTRLSASKGVQRADNAQEFLERFARLRPILEKEACEELIVENFFPGVEVALEGLLNHGQLHPLAIFDKPDPLDGPFFEETIYVTPSRLPAKAQSWIIHNTEKACAALGLREGPIHAELRLTLPLPSGEGRGEGIVVEVAARSIGGLCSRVLRFAQSESATLEELILRQAVGLELNLQREPQAGGVMMIPIPEAGLLREVSGVEAARRVRLIEEVEITAPLNYPLIPLPEGDSYLGFIFARGQTPAAVEAALREAHQLLHFTLTPEIPLMPA